MGRSENGAGGSGTPTGLVQIAPCARDECDGGWDVHHQLWFGFWFCLWFG